MPVESQTASPPKKWIADRCGALWLLVAPLAFLISLSGCASSLILLPPWHRPVAPLGATVVELPFRRGQLEVWTQPTKGGSGANTFVLEFCGNATPAESIVNVTAHRWREVATEVWVVNYPGYSGSTGPACLSAIAPASLAAYDALSAKAKGRPIYIAGTSLGTIAALHVAAHRPAAGVVLQNPPPLRELIWGDWGWWNLWLGAGIVTAQIPDELDSISNAAHVSAPAVFVLADHDTFVPPRFQQRVVAAFAGSTRIVVLNGANHNSHNTASQEKDIEEAIQWLRSTSSAYTIVHERMDSRQFQRH